MPHASWRYRLVLAFLRPRRQRQNPVPVYLALATGQAICFSLFFTVQLIYQVTVVGLDPLQMVVVGTVLGLAVSEFFKRTSPEALGTGVPARLLAAFAAVDVAAVVIFAVANALWLAFAMLWVRRIVATIGAPVQTAWLNRNLDSASRATVISMTGRANSIG